MAGYNCSLYFLRSPILPSGKACYPSAEFQFSLKVFLTFLLVSICFLSQKVLLGDVPNLRLTPPKTEWFSNCGDRVPLWVAFKSLETYSGL